MAILLFTILPSVLWGVTFCHLALALLLVFNRGRTPKLPAARFAPADPKSVLIVVPARN